MGTDTPRGARGCLAHLQRDASQAQLARALGFGRPATLNTSALEHLKALPALASAIFVDREGCPHNPS